MPEENEKWLWFAGSRFLIEVCLAFVVEAAGSVIIFPSPRILILA